MFDPMEICIFALRKYGVPEYILLELKPGIITDLWVQFVVMEEMEWKEAEQKIIKMVLASTITGNGLSC